MRRQKPAFSLLKFFISLLLVVMVIAGGVAASLWAAGIPMARLAFWRTSEQPKDAISLPMNWQVISAYSRVTRGDLLNPKTGTILGVEIPLTAVAGMSASYPSATGELVENRVKHAHRTDQGIVFQLEDGSMISDRELVLLGGAFVQASDIIGRVVKTEKSPGFAFSEANFFEKGTPAGLAGATPPGMRAMTLEAGKLAGVHRISLGEQIDLVANIPIRKLKRFEFATGSQLPGAELVLDSSRPERDSEKETTARLVARQAVVLMPVVKRVSTESSASLTEGKRLLNVPVEEVVLAVAAEDVASVTAALELDATVNVLVRSGRAELNPELRELPEGTVRVPIPGQSLLAYQAVRLSSFEDPATGYVRTVDVPAATAEASGWITDLSELVGRIPHHDLAATVPVRESDLMPAGTPAGLAGATPPGRVLFFLDAESLTGADALEFGQRLDLVASRTDESVGNGKGSQFANVSLTEAERTRVDPIAQDVLVIMPTSSPGNPTNRPENANDRDAESAKLILALRPEQVANLEYAVAVGSRLRATIRADRDSNDVALTDESMPLETQNRMQVMRFDPMSDAKQTQVFVGGKQQSYLFRAP